jgi:hypothetical protein
MFVNHMDDRSVSTVDGDIERKRGLLAKLHHAAYCQHEGHTVAAHCLSDPLCCASKRLFEHMSMCMETRCGVPCCKGSRRVWRHYRKCRHVNGCPLCSVLPSAYTSVGLAPRFLKTDSSSSVTSGGLNMSTGRSPQSSSHSMMTLDTTFEEYSTTAVVTPSKGSGSHQQRRSAVDGKENSNNVSSGFTSASSAGTENNVQIPWDQFQKQHRPQGPPPPTTPPIIKNLQQPQPQQPIPTTRRAESPNDSVSVGSKSIGSHKPPLSPRRPQWALF